LLALRVASKKVKEKERKTLLDEIINFDNLSLIGYTFFIATTRALPEQFTTFCVLCATTSN